MRGPGSGSTGSCSDQQVGVKRRGPWTPEEDELLAACVRREGEGKWRTLPRRAGLLRCGKSCRLRWMNYLRPSVKRGHIAPDEEDLILRLHRLLGNRWSLIAGRIPGRTDNEIKNYWNTHISKKLLSNGIDPKTHRPLSAKHNINDNYQNKSKKSISPSSAHVVAREQRATPTPQDSTVALGISPNTWTAGGALGFVVSDEDPFFDFPDRFVENDVIFNASDQQRLGYCCQEDDLHFLAPSVSLVAPEEDLLQCFNFAGSSSS